MCVIIAVVTNLGGYKNHLHCSRYISYIFFDHVHHSLPSSLSSAHTSSLSFVLSSSLSSFLSFILSSSLSFALSSSLSSSLSALSSALYITRTTLAAVSYLLWTFWRSGWA